MSLVINSLYQPQDCTLEEVLLHEQLTHCSVDHNDQGDEKESF